MSSARSRLARAWLLGGLAIAVTTLGVMVGGPAQAQVIRGDRDQYRSPQNFALELRFGPFRPDIDSEFDGARTPYQDFFGSDNRLMSQIELDWQIFRYYGTWGVGLGVGQFSATGNNRDAAGELTSDSSKLKITPLSLSAVYRFDWGYQATGIPLVPYAKVGLDYSLWSITDGNGEVPNDPTGGRGRGGTWGWHTALGLAVLLDILDPMSAQQFDSETGVNHTYLFGEIGRWDVSGFGASGKLRVGDTTWMAGLMFEF